MTQSGLPENVRAFLSAHIRSIGELEVLLLLQRNPLRWWSAHQVNGELKTSLEAATKHLEHLHGARLLQQRTAAVQEYRFDAADAHLAAIVQLAALSKDWLTSIVEAIYAPRKSSIRDFAEAFRVGKKGDQNDG